MSPIETVCGQDLSNLQVSLSTIERRLSISPGMTGTFSMRCFLSSSSEGIFRSNEINLWLGPYLANEGSPLLLFPFFGSEDRTVYFSSEAFLGLIDCPAELIQIQSPDDHNVDVRPDLFVALGHRTIDEADLDIFYARHALSEEVSYAHGFEEYRLQIGIDRAVLVNTIVPDISLLRAREQTDPLQVLELPLQTGRSLTEFLRQPMEVESLCGMTQEESEKLGPHR